jgi:uncharacterized protein
VARGRGYTAGRMLTEYRALVAKVALFTDATATRRAADLRCSEGCSSCCQVWLSVSAVEAEQLREALRALPKTERDRLRARGARELAREAELTLSAHAAEDAAPHAVPEPPRSTAAHEPRCAMLDEQERCSVYQGRPLVCRTQGHALRYPAGFIPSAAITRKSANGDETWCPLNYDAAEPEPADVLDAERVDQILAVVSARYVVAARNDAAGSAGQGNDPKRRFTLSELAAEEDV